MDELDKPIGTKEHAKLAAGSVLVRSVSLKEQLTKKGGKAKLVVFTCKHPDKEEEINLSNIKIKKVQGNNETIMKDALWYNTDEDGNIDKRSNPAELMRFYNKPTLKAFEGSAITTEADASGYLCIKAY